MRAITAARKLIFGFTIVVLPALANDTVKVNRTVPYQDETVGTPEIRNECEWNTRLIENLVKYSKGRVEITDQDTRNMPGKTLTLVVTAVHSAGGSVFSGPKWGRIRGELRQDGKVVSAFKVGAISAADVFRWSACGTLNKVSKKLGLYTAKWLRNPVDNAEIGDREDTVPEVAPEPEGAKETK